jgi:hypothetical protein
MLYAVFVAGRMFLAKKDSPTEGRDEDTRGSGIQVRVGEKRIGIYGAGGLPLYLELAKLTGLYRNLDKLAGVRVDLGLK